MKLYKIVLLLCFLLVNQFLEASNGEKFSHMDEKKIHREFKYKPGMLLNVHNSYGNIDITAWEGNKIIVDALVIVKGETKAEVDELLKKVDIAFSENLKEGIITLLTRKETYKYNDYREIHYQIKVPKSCHLSITNNYGDISLDASNASVSLKAYYGNIKAGKLNGVAKIETSFSQRNSFDYIKKGTIKGQFCDYKIMKSEVLEIRDMASSNGVIQEVSNLKYKCNYGSLTIGNVTNSLEGKGEYLTMNIENSNVQEKMKIEAYYGYVDIKNWNNYSAEFDIDNAKLILGYNNNISFGYNILTRDCIVESIINNLPKDFKRHHSDDKGNNQRICGYFKEKFSKNYLLLEMVNSILKFENSKPITP
ncbi:hypothetical protein [Pseudofulvibacter geojedonensis]|uniref:Adhesin domain-containing protein n=1 Tax=Pseudofulvibacter geojedonensis TaxID=1123758 RepID=A0ABW3I2C1_9FLAO